MNAWDGAAVHRGVSIVVDKKFTPYTVRYRYWSSTPLFWSFEGLPDAFANALRPHFHSVNVLPVGGSTPTGPHDLIARMSVDQLHFDGANTTLGNDRVDLAMMFTVEQPDGEETFRATISASGSSEYVQRCAFCRPDPPEAFPLAFKAAFIKLSQTLSARMVTRVAPRTFPSRQLAVRRLPGSPPGLQSRS